MHPNRQTNPAPPSIENQNPDQNPDQILETAITHQAQHYLNQLLKAFETKQLAKTPLLERLHQDLSNALSAYENSLNQNNHPSETIDQQSLTTQQLEKKHHLQWLCNQGRYYLTQTYERPEQHKNRARWQIKATIHALTKFRLIVHLRNRLPGKAPKMIAWRDILPGFRL